MMIRPPFRILAVLGAGALLAGTAVLPASAQVVFQGQSLKVSDYNCGSNERIFDKGPTIKGIPLYQHAMVYRHCGSGSVKRKADVIADTDGKCTTIQAGKAIVIHQEYAFLTRTVYRSSKSC